MRICNDSYMEQKQTNHKYAYGLFILVINHLMLCLWLLPSGVHEHVHRNLSVFIPIY